jgi:cell division topological specificity factor
MSLLEFLQRMIGRQAPSATLAKQRLQLVLAHDRSDLNPELLEQMRREILEVVQRYVEIDLEEVDVSLETEDRVTALVANLPIRSAKPVRRPEPSLVSPPAAAAEGQAPEVTEPSPTVEALQRAAASLPPSEENASSGSEGDSVPSSQPWS